MEMRIRDATAHSLHREVRYSVAEHEVLINFVNDEGAEFFNEWWYLADKDLFTQYVSQQLTNPNIGAPYESE